MRGEPITFTNAQGIDVTGITWANALSVLRLIVALPCAYSIWTGSWRLAATLFVVAVVTDVFDGIVARRRGEVTIFGGLLDHTIDALFVTVTLGALAASGIVPFVLPPLAITSFVQYVWDSKALSGAPLRASVLGRWNGIGYFVVVGTVVIRQALGLTWPAEFVILLMAWALVASTVVSMGDRAYALWLVKKR
jgi:phosphatidylglycerophosphate synthase